MSAALVPPPLDNAPELRRKRFTRMEVNRMLKSGIFDDQRFELIDGELIDKMGQGPRHANAVRRLKRLLDRVFGPDRVEMQMPIEAGPRDRPWSQPEPDLLVLAVADEYPTRHPHGHELSLAVEVADSSIRQDAKRKRDMYAHARIPEYWVLDLDGSRSTGG